MSWAAGRRTTRVEDVAYSLLGLFGVNMPLLYGEGEGAFVRLQEEIMKNTDDLSLLAWHDSGSGGGAGTERALASDPSAFQYSERVVRISPVSTAVPHSMTNRGLMINMPLIPTVSRDPEGNPISIGLLNCRMEDNLTHAIGKALRPAWSSDTFLRFSGNGFGLMQVPLEQVVQAKSRTIYLVQQVFARHARPRKYSCRIKSGAVSAHGYQAEGLVKPSIEGIWYSWDLNTQVVEIKFDENILGCAIGFLICNIHCHSGLLVVLTHSSTSTSSTTSVDLWTNKHATFDEWQKGLVDQLDSHHLTAHLTSGAEKVHLPYMPPPGFVKDKRLFEVATLLRKDMIWNRETWVIDLILGRALEGASKS
ncbi:hypothetical protein EJ08DRAFT_705073 [Tothia fuscella]|uniref:DUF8212 domain-containing protein n=1 Tax=Tothia fuscella TaxID=1048955 RepID=A0A9P4U2L2_9PEZI|nr:hypothetical protein EJ08DRAFT_705073 [Tothia fuscella]